MVSLAQQMKADLVGVAGRVAKAARAFGILGAVATGLCSAPSLADTFNFKGGNSSSTGAVNARPFNSTTAGSSLSTTATAYSTSSNTSSATLSRQYLGWYSPGLGVTNSTDSSHTVDNNGRTDLIVFQFSAVVKITQIMVAAFGGTDFQVWTGNLPSGYDFSGKTIANLGSILTSGGISVGGTADRTATFANLAIGNYLVIAADPTSTNDAFKIAGLNALATPGPIAGAGLPVMVMLGLAGLVMRRRNRTA